MPLIRDFVAGRTPPDLYETYLADGLFSPWADVLIEAARPTDVCLDIACGTGVISRKLAELSEVSQIQAIDVAPPMIEKAIALQKEKGLAPKVNFQVASALDLPFEDDTFDTAICQQGLQFFPDKAAALKEAIRVLRPGGTLAVAVWTAANDGNPVFGAFENIVADHLGSDLVPFGPFSLGDRDEIEKIAESANLCIDSLKRRELLTKLPDVRSFVLFDLLFLGRPGSDGSLQPVVDPEDPDGDAIIEKIIDELTARTAQHMGIDGGLEALTTAHILTFTKS
ncbi:MAG: class I SAM-dependent methyltransferase [Parasphingorhabdus sp.]